MRTREAGPSYYGAGVGIELRCRFVALLSSWFGKVCAPVRPAHVDAMLKLLFIGDIVGRPGRDIIAERLPRLRTERGIDFVIANGENAAAGAGITGSIAKSLLENGVDAITLGDHVWDQRGWENEITEIERVCRPANLPTRCPGWDHLIIESRGFRVAVFTVLGRSFMNMKADCPFQTADRLVEQLRPQADAIIVEFHAEATSEKQAIGILMAA
jgi:2',3'-cyclic-nucleotide 2'-phosphodiesterase